MTTDVKEETNKETNGNTAITADTIMEALREVMDPELHLDVVALGLIREVILTATPIEVKMLLTTPFCPYGPWMVGQVKETAQKAANNQEVKVEVLPEMWNPEMMEDPTMLGFF